MEQIHDGIVKRLESHIGDRYLDFVDWKKGRRCGEIDLISWDDKGRLTFYEIKVTDKHKRLNKARRQYYNFLHAYQQSPSEIPGYAYFGDGRLVRL